MALWRMQVKLAFSGGVGHGTNTWHLRSTGIEPDDTDLQAMVNAIKTFYQAAFGGSCPTSSHAVCDGQLQEFKSDEPRAIAVTGFDVPGALSGGMAASANQIVVCWRTANSSRQGRGRTFLGPISALAVQSDGSVTDTVVTSTRNAATALANASKGFSNGAVVVYSKMQGGIARDIIAGTVNDKVAVLTSRRG